MVGMGVRRRATDRCRGSLGQIGEYLPRYCAILMGNMFEYASAKLGHRAPRER
jgi:hypothetical protein